MNNKPFNNLRVSHQISEEGLESYRGDDETEENYMHKKELMHLEDDRSVTLDNSLIDDDRTGNNSEFVYQNKKNTQVKQGETKNPHEELLKFISDTSDIFSNTKNLTNLDIIDNIRSNYRSNIFPIDKKILKVNKFDLYIPSAPRSSERVFTLNNYSQNSLSNSTKSDYHEVKYKELFHSYNNALDMVKSWQIFYTQIIHVLNDLLLLNHNSMTTSDYFKEEVKSNVLGIVNELVKNYKKSKEFKSKFKFTAGQFTIKGIKPDSKLTVQRSNSLELERNTKQLSIIKEGSFILESLSTRLNEDKQSPKAKTREQLPLSVSKQKGKINFDSLRMSVDKEQCRQYEINKTTFVECIPTTKKERVLLLTSEHFLLTCKKNSPETTTNTQTNLTNDEIDKLYILNEEYSRQLIFFKHEKEIIEKHYKENIKKLEDQQRNEDNSIDYIPEMIPPEQTLKIFIRNSLITL